MTPSERGVLYTQRQDFSPSPKARATALHNIHSRLKKKKNVYKYLMYFSLTVMKVGPVLLTEEKHFFHTLRLKGEE